MAYVAWSELNWPRAQALGSDPRSVALVPLGAIEQHGPHLPLATDSLVTEALARAVAERVDRPVLVTPVITGGLSSHHTGFAGTISLDVDTLEAVLVAFFDAFRRTGVRRCALISAHGGNFADIGRYAERHTSADLRVSGCSDLAAYFQVKFKAARELGIELPSSDIHAGGIETGLAQHLFPNLVADGWASVQGLDEDSPELVARVLTDGVKAVSETGVLGVPAKATPELGALVFTRLVDHLAAWLEGELHAPGDPTDAAAPETA